MSEESEGMDVMPVSVVIMAAGKGTRMKSDLPKVLHEFRGEPLLSHVIRTARSVGPEKIVVVAGHGRELVMDRFAGEGVEFAVQEPQLGTGHAVAQAEKALEGFHGAVVVLSGDVPLLKKETVEEMLDTFRRTGSAITALTCELDEPGAYGRIVRRGGRVVANVEARDATPEQLAIKEINTGIYAFDARFLFSALRSVNRDNAQGEYYLTDLIAIAVEEGKAVTAVAARDPLEIQGVNTVEQLRSLESGAKAP